MALDKILPSSEKKISKRRPSSIFNDNVPELSTSNINNENSSHIEEEVEDQEDQDHPVVTRTRLVVEYPHSIFNNSEKYTIALICGISGFWSAVSANIYYPIIYTIEQKFHVTEELANVSVVLYFVFQGIAPMFTASIADAIGRKPVVLACCVIYVVACVCLAVSNTYGLILFLRCVQAAGIAPVIAINSGVCADLATRATRGSLIGFTSGIQLLAQALGALIGGLLASGFNSWRSIFWFLAIGCGVTAVVSFFFLPETKRTIVGNGSIPPKKFINKSPLWLIPHYKKKLTNDLPTLEAKDKSQTLLSKLFDVPVIASNKEIFMVLFPCSLYFTSWSMMFTSLSTTLQTKRHYSVQRVGLCFLAPGIAGSMGSFMSGRLLDLYYRHYHAKYQKAIEKYQASKEDPTAKKPEFNIFQCRLSMLFPCGCLFSSGLLIFGWCLDTDQPLAAILIGTFMASLVNSPFVSVSTNLLADLYPSKTSTSTATVNLFRCLIAACGVSALSKMQLALTIGGCFTLMAGFCMLSLIPLYVVMWKGSQWVRKRQQKEDRKMELKEKK